MFILEGNTGNLFWDDMSSVLWNANAPQTGKRKPNSQRGGAKGNLVARGTEYKAMSGDDKIIDIQNELDRTKGVMKDNIRRSTWRKSF